MICAESHVNLKLKGTHFWFELYRDMPKVVVLGGSFAGLTAAHSILKDCPDVHVTLVNPRDEFYFCIAGPRIFANPKFFKQKQYLLPLNGAFDKYGSKFEFVQDLAKSIDVSNNTVLLSNTKSLSFDYLVIATGTRTNYAPLKPLENTVETIKALQDEIARATSIVVGGGGPLGIELAGEIATYYPEKKIVLVSASSRLLDMLKPSSGATAKKNLTNLMVDVIEGTKVVGYEEGRALLDSGKTIDADLYIPSTGVKPNNEAIPQSLLSSKGFVKVNEYMRAAPRIYAAGDITDLSQKVSFRATEQAAVVASNIKSEISGVSPSKKFKEGGVMMLVPTGPSTGTGQMFGWVPWGFMVRMFKGKDFFIGNARTTVYQ